MKVLIADDRALFRQGLTRFLSASFRDLSVAEAGGFFDVMAQKDRLLEFDLILLDWAMPGTEGSPGWR